MRRGDAASQGQLLALCSVTALTPALRLLPRGSAALAGRGGWLSVLLALPAAALYAAFLWDFLRRRREGETLRALLLRAAGRRLGAALTALCALWFLFYAAFTLRDSAQRLIVTVYPHADRRVFILPLAAAAALAATGGALRLMRTAKLILPPLLGLIALTLLFALPGLSRDELLPLGLWEAPRLLCGTLPTLDTAALVLTLLFFLSDALSEPGSYRRVALRIALLGSLMAALTATVIGSFGHELMARLARPYFTLVRGLVFFRSLERTEALTAAFWLFSDFLLTAALLLCARRCLGAERAESAAGSGSRARLPAFGREKLLFAALGAAAALGACLLAPEEASFERLSLRVVPALNAGVCLLLLPGVYALGRARKRI